MGIIDFHTHAFPDALAERAVKHLAAKADVQPALDGTIGSLMKSMDEANIEKSVVCSIATKPSQFSPILEWSKRIASDRIIPFPSVHPEDPETTAHMRAVREAGFTGVKLHPYYQEFKLDEPRVRPLFEAALENDLIVVCHTGYDIGFPRYRVAEPVRIANLMRDLPDLKFVATHLGAWEEWDSVRELLIGTPLYIEVSYALPYMDAGAMRELINSHGREYLLFGTDSPWADQKGYAEAIRRLDLDPARTQALFRDNAARLLGLS